jgi:signal transduction histidine kinase
MDRAHPGKRPTFLWQGLMIVLPVLALAAVGALSVRQDKALARSEATERAQAMADELLPKLWQELTVPKTPAAFEHHAFKVGRSGELVFPPSYVPVPVPAAFDLSALSADQLQLWLAARAVDADGGDPAAGVEAYQQFLQADPPSKFAAAVTYCLGLLLLKQAKTNEAVGKFYSVAEHYPNAVGDTGLPLRPLAEWQLVQLDAVTPPPPKGEAGVDLRGLGIARNQAQVTTNYQIETAPVSLDRFCSNLVYSPTMLSSFLLGELEPGSALVSRDVRDRLLFHEEIVRKWQTLWREHEQSRQLYAAFHQALATDDVARPRPGARPDAALLSAESGSPRIRGTVGQDTSGPSDRPTPFWFRPQLDLVTESTIRTAGASASSDSLAADLDLKDDLWLAIPTDLSTNGYQVICRSETELGETSKALVEADKQIPEYLGIGLELCGRKLTRLAPDLRLWRDVGYIGRKGGGIKKEFMPEAATTLLASATHRESGAELMRVNMFLTSPANLYQRQRARAFWFGALIVTAAVAAGMGLLAAYRAFARQLVLSEMKTNFVSSVSHELRAPIAAVRLMAESLERGKIAEEPKQREYFRFIVQECRRLSGLIENVLDFSRIEQGRKQYDFEPTDLAALAQQTVKLMEPYAAERQVHLQFSLPDHQPQEASKVRERLPLTPTLSPAGGERERAQSVLSPTINADGKAIQQALVNLIDNAIKHSPKDGTVTIGLERGQGMLLWVEDHGEGIPAQEHEKIFERFYRRGSELRRETQGVGIGLSLVKHIVEAHGGRVTVRSVPGQGSRFTIALPAPPGHSNSQA